jgi:hypothetical protein
MKKSLLLLLLALVANTLLCKAQPDTLTITPHASFVDTLVFSFGTDEGDTITLEMYNRWGNRIVSFLNKEIMPADNYEYIYAGGDSLETGTYFVSFIRNGSREGTKYVYKTDSAVGIRKNKVATDYLFLYPNPSTTYITIGIEGEKQIAITNLQGKEVRRFSTTEENISVLDLPTGQYILTVQYENGERIGFGKFIKQ